MKVRYWIKGHEQHLSAAIGESLYPRDGLDAETLLHRADQNMYRIKSRSQQVAAGVGVSYVLNRRHDDKSKTSIGGDP